jgi:DnaA family protein
LSQLALPLKLQDHAVFESFWPAGNDTLLSFLGAAATGKTHLLQAVCEKSHDAAVYVPLAQLSEAGPGILEGLASRQFVCLDDVHNVAQDPEWELALFELYNEISDRSGALLATATTAPRECRFELADLASRDDTANFLLNRSKRDMASLYALLDQLDTAALEAQRRLTIPFVKDTLKAIR